MADIRSRIQKQQQMMKGYQALRSASGNPDVQRQADSNIRDAQRNISYLEESLQALINRRASSMGPKTGGSVSSGISSSAGAYNSASSGGPTPFGSSQASFQSSGSSSSIHQQQQQQQAPGGGRPFPGDAASAYLQQQRNPNDSGARAGAAGYASADGYNGGMQGRGGEWQPAPINRMGTSAKRNYTNLGE
jgi:classical protein kinase C